MTDRRQLPRNPLAIDLHEIIQVQLHTFMLLIVIILLCVALLTLLERKIMGLIQRRRGPNVVGFFGLLQPFSDGLKLFLKECVIPSRANFIIYSISPLIAMSVSLFVWVVLPFNLNVSIVRSDVGLLFVLAILSLNTYSVLLGGWSSNSKYAFLGALRASAQMISYEVAMGLCILTVCLLSGSLRLDVINSYYNVFVLCPSFILFFICLLAETYRTPFDFTEAEGELVSGFNVEYSSMGFALFFLGEYTSIIFMCFFTSVLFFGGVSIVIIFLLIFLIVWIRSTLPRYRYDQLMRLGWRVVMPLGVVYLVIITVGVNINV